MNKKKTDKPRKPAAAKPRKAAASDPRTPRAKEKVLSELQGDLFGDLDAAFPEAGELEAEDGAVAENETQTPERAAPPKRVLEPESDAPKLHKVLAQAGMGSRLDMEKMIADGRITVNREPAHVGQRIREGDRIQIDGKPVRLRIEPPAMRIIAYHKPAGELVTHDDPQNRPTVFRTLPRLHQGKWLAVGRLDINTEGLLLITNSGELANQLMHPRFGLQREYAARVLGALSEEEKQKLRDGIELEDGPAQFLNIEEAGGEGANCWYRVTIAEGRNREVRRMFETLGHAVSRLIRVRYGTLQLPRGLRRGKWMELGPRDSKAVMDAAGMPSTPAKRERGSPSTKRSPDRGSKRQTRASLPPARAPRFDRGDAPYDNRSSRTGDDATRPARDSRTGADSTAAPRATQRRTPDGFASRTRSNEGRPPRFGSEGARAPRRADDAPYAPRRPRSETGAAPRTTGQRRSPDGFAPAARSSNARSDAPRRSTSSRPGSSRPSSSRSDPAFGNKSSSRKPTSPRRPRST